MSSFWGKTGIGRYLLLVLIFILYFIIGVLKWNYIINPGIVKGDWLLYRYTREIQANYNVHYNDPIRHFLITPKWISTLIYGNAFLLLNLVIIYLTYYRKEYLSFTFWLFSIVSILSVVILALGVFLGIYDIVYPIISRIKELQQSPFTLILLLGAFRLHRSNQIREEG